MFQLCWALSMSCRWRPWPFDGGKRTLAAHFSNSPSSSISYFETMSNQLRLMSSSPPPPPVRPPSCIFFNAMCYTPLTTHIRLLTVYRLDQRAAECSEQRIMSVTYLFALLICDVGNIADHVLWVHLHIVIMSFSPIFHPPKPAVYQGENNELG